MGFASLYPSYALTVLHGLKYELLTTLFMTAISEGLARMGKVDQAAHAIDETIALVDRNGDLVMMPELLRVKGAIMTSADAKEPAKIESCYMNSLDLARRQHALAWELRMATSLPAFGSNKAALMKLTMCLHRCTSVLARSLKPPI